ncbi:MAG TPA: family 16 glycosylhydrolase [Verrucomicrobiae bacterium]|nr:family 16 glycosylhydrolase [Verrucomicrobiae bacterium]
MKAGNRSLSKLAACVIVAVSFLRGPFCPIAATAEWVDNFTSDSILNTALWTTDSGLLSALAVASSDVGSTLITPTLSFGPTGMQMSGVNSTYELAGIQSLSTFAPPITLNITVAGTVANGNPFDVFLVSSDLSQRIDISGNLNSANGDYYGVWVNYTGSGLGLWQLGDLFYGSPSTGVFYTIQISVGTDGNASISLADANGNTLASQDGLPVGTGPFYIVLAQREGLPYTVGPNVAIWQSASVTASGSSEIGSLAIPCINGLQVEINGAPLPAGPLTSINWDWGDGQQTVQWAPGSHTYSSAGQYLVTMTLNYTNGTTASATGTVSVAPGVLSNCDALQISAGQGGTVSYQCSVGSGTVPSGGDVTLQRCYGGDTLLVANPGPTFGFSDWSVSSGISVINGTPLTSNSIYVAVGTNSQIAANFSVGCDQTTPSRFHLRVPAKVKWFDTGLDLFEGEAATITASGTISVGALNPTYKSETPVGQPGVTPLGTPVLAPNLTAWSLVGRVGSSGAPFEIGTGTNFFVSGNGRLYVSVNDNLFSDNSGDWSVSASIAGGPCMVWNDEFIGASGSPPDTTHWDYDLGYGLWGNDEQETYTSDAENAHLDGHGHLVITAIKGSGGSYSSARITTKDHFPIQYGMIEARMRLPVGRGIWPAFWMLGSDIDTNAWPACGEVDIMENVETNGCDGDWIGPTRVQSSLHGLPNTNGPCMLYSFRNGQSVKQYHTYGVIWTPRQIQFFVDDPGNIFGSFTRDEVAGQGVNWAFDHPFYLLLNLAVGGTNSWSGAPDKHTKFPAKMLVDYVRVYQWNMR